MRWPASERIGERRAPSWLVKSDRPRRRTPRAPRTRDRGPAPTPDAGAQRRSPRERFLATNRYRAEREWQRYEGTPQRDLFRQLRVRFLLRHAVDGAWALDVGAGPGRFTPFVGGPSARRVALDLAGPMLEAIPKHLAACAPECLRTLERVRGDSLRPPFRPRTFGEVAVLGNTLGFAGERGLELLSECEELVAPGGTLVVEIAPGPGERSRYLERLPPRAVGRLLIAPSRALVPRIAREGFLAEPVRHDNPSFRRWDAGVVIRRWESLGWEPLEVLAVAPALGPDNARSAEVQLQPRAWGHLLEIEEALGRREERWPLAAAVLLSARRGPLNPTS